MEPWKHFVNFMIFHTIRVYNYTPVMILHSTLMQLILSILKSHSKKKIQLPDERTRWRKPGNRCILNLLTEVDSIAISHISISDLMGSRFPSIIKIRYSSLQCGPSTDKSSRIKILQKYGIFIEWANFNKSTFVRGLSGEFKSILFF